MGCRAGAKSPPAVVKGVFMTEEPDPVPAAREAIGELRRLIAADAQGCTEQDLMRLADQAASWLAEGRRREIADKIIGGLTVLRFGKTFGLDGEPGRRQALAILDAMDTALG
jgi:hypothetical protein